MTSGETMAARGSGPYADELHRPDRPDPGSVVCLGRAPEPGTEQANVEPAPISGMAKVRTMPRGLMTAALAWLRDRYRRLKTRYGPRYTSVMVGAAFFTLFVPVPGLSLVSVALIVAVAEAHRRVRQ